MCVCVCVCMCDTFLTVVCSQKLGCILHILYGPNATSIQHFTDRAQQIADKKENLMKTDSRAQKPFLNGTVRLRSACHWI